MSHSKRSNDSDGSAAGAGVAPFQVRVQPGGWYFPILPAQSVLEAALAANITMPSACRNGTCRVCLCRLLDGKIAYRVQWPGVSAPERAEGLFLPCSALAESDLLIEQPAAHPAPARGPARVRLPTRFR